MGNKPRIRFKGFTEDWEQRKLGEFVKIISGDAPSTFISGRCIYVKVDDLNYSDRIQLSSSNLVNINPKAHLVNKGATIFPKRGAAIMTNKVRIMGKDGYLDTNMMALIPEEIDKDFLFTFIQKTGLYKIADTSTIPQINNKHIEPYMIQVPNDKEQECIGVVFEKIDKIITLHQCKLEKLKLTKKALLQKLFPKNGKHIPEIRFKGFTDAWEQRKLSDVADVRDGTHDSPKFYNDGFPLVTSKNLKGGSIDFSDCSFISEQDFNEINKRSKVDPGDILFGMIGTIGNPAIVEHTGFAIKNVALIKEGNIINNRFIYHLLSSKVFENYIARENAGGTQKFIALNQIRNFDFLAPALVEQNKIIELLDCISQNITLHQRKLERLQEVKKGLLQKMFV